MKKIVLLLLCTVQISAMENGAIKAFKFDDLLHVEERPTKVVDDKTGTTYDPYAWYEDDVCNEDSDNEESEDLGLRRFCTLQRHSETASGSEMEFVQVSAVKTAQGDFKINPLQSFLYYVSLPENPSKASIIMSTISNWKKYQVLRATHMVNGNSTRRQKIKAARTLKPLLEKGEIEVTEMGWADEKNVRVESVESIPGYRKEHAQKAIITFQDSRTKKTRVENGLWNLWTVHYETASQFTAYYTWKRIEEYTDHHRVVVGNNAKDVETVVRKLTEKGRGYAWRFGTSAGCVAALAALVYQLRR